MRNVLRPLLLSFIVLSAGIAYATEPEWTTLLSDDFEREMAGENWHLLRGDWRIEEGRLVCTRQWGSHSYAFCRIPLRAENVDVAFDCSLGANCVTTVSLRSGEFNWGGGGINEPISVEIIAASGSDLPVELVDGKLRIPLDQSVRIGMRYIDGMFTLTADGNTILTRAEPESLGESNPFFEIVVIPNGSFDNVVLRVSKDSGRKHMIASSPEENIRATVDASSFLDRSDPACGFQKAIDSLPPQGGVVLLPEGEFVMRRHLELKSNTTLCGRGAERTILRAAPASATKITSTTDGDISCSVEVEDSAPFRIGDAVYFGTGWDDYSQLSIGMQNKDTFVLAKEGNRLTLSRRLDSENKLSQLSHFFPLVFSYCSEFVEVRDLTLAGEQNDSVQVSSSNPILFRSVANPRISRVEVRGWKGDGIQTHTCANLLLTDNTVSGTAHALQVNMSARGICARNLATGNRNGGIFFHLYNQNGICFRNTFDSILGYPDMGDVFTSVTANVSVQAMKIQSSYNGLLVGNGIPSIVLEGEDPVVGKHLYRQAPRHLVIAANAIDLIDAKPVVKGCVCAANRKWRSPETPSECTLDPATNSVTPENETGVDLSIRSRGLRPGIVLGETLNIPIGASRVRPTPPVPTRDPVVNAEAILDPTLPDLGLQSALDRIGSQGGGTLQIPGGRYALGAALVIPSGTTLAGHGIGSILVPKEGYAGPLLKMAEGTGAKVLNLSIIGPYATTLPAAPEPAILSEGMQDLEIREVDVRGWNGDAFRIVSGSADIVNCRALSCAGDGFSTETGEIRIETSLADHCRIGFRIAGSEKAAPRISGCVAGNCSDDGFLFDGGNGAWAFGNASSFSVGSGYRIRNGSKAILIGNQASMNNLGSRDTAAGIVLEGETRDCVVAYNSCSDEQIHPTQFPGILETDTVSGSRLVGNLTSPVQFHPKRPESDSLVSAGRDAHVSGNMTKPFLPGGSSIEFRDKGRQGRQGQQGRQGRQGRQGSIQSIAPTGGGPGPWGQSRSDQERPPSLWATISRRVASSSRNDSTGPHSGWTMERRRRKSAIGKSWVRHFSRYSTNPVRTRTCSSSQ